MGSEEMIAGKAGSAGKPGIPFGRRDQRDRYSLKSFCTKW